jgi:hypothetical protein
VPASGAKEDCDFPLFFIHITVSISHNIYTVKYLIKNILLKVLTNNVICDILFIVIVIELSKGGLKWNFGNKED